MYTEDYLVVLRRLKTMCEDSNCMECPLGNVCDDLFCCVDTPCYWKIEAEEIKI